MWISPQKSSQSSISFPTALRMPHCWRSAARHSSFVLSRQGDSMIGCCRLAWSAKVCIGGNRTQLLAWWSYEWITSCNVHTLTTGFGHNHVHFSLSWSYCWWSIEGIFSRSGWVSATSTVNLCTMCIPAPTLSTRGTSVTCWYLDIV